MSFTIHIDGDFVLDLEQIWPDGNAPDEPTAEDVVKVLESCGSLFSVLNDWCLDPRVVVYGPGRSSQRAEAWK